MSLVSLVEWNVLLGSADVSWGGVRAIRTAAKETTILAVYHLFYIFYSRLTMLAQHFFFYIK